MSTLPAVAVAEDAPPEPAPPESAPPESAPPQSAPAEPAPPELAEAVPAGLRLAAVLEQRLAVGFDGVDGLRLWTTAAGAELAASRTTALRGMLLAMVPIGTVEIPVGMRRRAASFGLGGSFALRVTPWLDAPVSPFVHAELGLLLFSSDFLPGGTRYEFLTALALGLHIALGDELALDVSARLVHLSNGQGLGDHNPAFDGVGGALELTYAPIGQPPRPDPWRDRGEPTERPETPGVTLDAALGEVDEQLLATGRLRVAQKITGPLLAVLDAESGVLAREPLGEVGLALVLHLGLASVGVHAAYRNFAGLESGVLVGQLAWHAVDELSVVAMGHYESGPFGEVRRAALAVRLFPSMFLRVDLGLALDDIAGDAEAVDPYLSIEGQLPIGARGWQLALFAESRASGVRRAGVRVSWGVGETLRDAARSQSWRRVE